MLSARFAALVLVLALSLAAPACSSDDPGPCPPVGPVRVGAVGTIGAPLQDYADCYAGAMPAVSLDGERTGTASDIDIVFDDVGLEGTIDDQCRVTITYAFDTMLSDGTPATGTSVFAADPDLDAPGTWVYSPQGSTIFEWDDGLDGAVCGNVINDVYIVIEAR